MSLVGRALMPLMLSGALVARLALLTATQITKPIQMRKSRTMILQISHASEEALVILLFLGK